MLSINQCRELLGEDQQLNDEQIRALRDQLYELAHAAVLAAGTETDQLRGSEPFPKDN